VLESIYFKQLPCSFRHHVSMHGIKNNRSRVVHDKSGMLLSPPRARDKVLARPAFSCFANTPKTKKIPELYDNIAIDNTGIHLFLQCGFQELIASSREKQQRVASKKVGGRGIIRSLLVFFC